MLEISNELELAFNSASPKNLVLSFDDGTVIDNEDIALESMELEQTACDENELVFGKVNSACFKVKIKGTTKNYKGLWFNASLFCEEHELPLGRFFVYTDTATSDRQYREIVAYDKLFFAMNTDVSEWYKTLVFPMSLEEFRNELFDYLGIEQENIYLPNDGIILEKTVDGNGLTGQSVISAICELNACFGIINNFGKFKYVRMRNINADALYPNEDLYPSEDLYPNDLYDANITSADYRQGSLKYEEFSTRTITKVNIRENTDDLGYSIGVDGNTYVIEDNFLMYGADDETLSAVANAFLENAQFVSYTPASFSCKGKPWLEVGDLLNVYGTDKVFAMPILNRVLSGIQALKDTFSAKGTETYGETQNIGYKAEIMRLKGRTNTLTRTLDETRSELTRVEQDVNGELQSMGSSITQTAQKIELEVQRATGAENNLSSRVTQTENGISTEVQRATGAESSLSTRITQNADSITSEVQRASQAEGALSSRITQNANSIVSKVSKGTVSSEISQEANRITITGDRFVLNATNIQIDASGNVTIQGVLKSGSGSTIGGMKVDNNSIFGNGKAITETNPSWSSITDGFAFMRPGGSGTKISLGHSPKMSGWTFGCYPNFGVTKTGNIYGTKAYFNSISGDAAEIRVTDVNNNTTEVYGNSIVVSSGGGLQNATYTSTGVEYENVQIDGSAGEITIGSTTLTESDLERLLELI